MTPCIVAEGWAWKHHRTTGWWGVPRAALRWIVIETRINPVVGTEVRVSYRHQAEPRSDDEDRPWVSGSSLRAIFSFGPLEDGVWDPDILAKPSPLPALASEVLSREGQNHVILRSSQCANPTFELVISAPDAQLVWLVRVIREAAGQRPRTFPPLSSPSQS